MVAIFTAKWTWVTKITAPTETIAMPTEMPLVTRIATNKPAKVSETYTLSVGHML
ncbi:hypothetical protein HK405_004757, partial [Cladochytrium tenue]